MNQPDLHINRNQNKLAFMNVFVAGARNSHMREVRELLEHIICVLIQSHDMYSGSVFTINVEKQNCVDSDDFLK